MNTREDDDYFDLQGYIDSEIASGKNEIVIPSARILASGGNIENRSYRIKPRNKQHLLLKGLRDIKIIARNIEMVCKETTRAISVINCHDVTIQGLTIDYDPLPFTQGKIIGFENHDSPRLTHLIELFDGYLTSKYVDANNYEIYNPDSRHLRYGNYFGFSLDKSSSDPRRIAVTLPQKYADNPNFERPEQIGDIIAIGCTHAPNGKIPHAICATNCSGLRMEDITIYSSSNFGFLERNCSSSLYLRCKVDRRSPTTDPHLREDARIRSLNADAFHSKNAKVGPSIINCVARYNGDDSVNICGDYHFITSATEWTNSENDNYQCCELRVLAKNNFGINIQTGDRVELAAYSGGRFRDTPVVLSVSSNGYVTDDEAKFIKEQNIDKEIKTNGLKRAFRIKLSTIRTTKTFNGPAVKSRSQSTYREKLTMGSLIASMNHVGNGFVVEGCNFGPNRSRGIVVKGNQGKIAQNTLSGNWGEALRVAPSYWWLESGNSNDVRIRDNTIRDCHSYGIGVYSIGSDSNGRRNFAPSGAHSKMIIAQNKLIRCPLPNILFTSTDGYRIQYNDYQEPLENTMADGPANVKRILHHKKLQKLMIIECENGIITGSSH